MYIYIHLPFCLSRCIYCDFSIVLGNTDERRSAYLSALLKQIEAEWRFEASQPAIQTVYFGGGTPALFQADDIERILAALAQKAAFAPDVEITMEANPERMASSLADYRQAGINRLSVGVQSLQPNELKRLSRLHSVDDVYRFVDQAHQVGLVNLSLDFMYGIPEQTLDSWLDTVQRALQLQPTHISMYGLQVEEGTLMERLLHQGRLARPGDEVIASMYFDGVALLESGGFALYEISNLAKPGYESRHNLNYWAMGDFYGFGLGAHGLYHHQMTENTADWETYLADSTSKQSQTVFSSQQQCENALIFGLRRRQGIKLSEIKARFGVDVMATWREPLEPFIAHGYLTCVQDQLALTVSGFAVSNTILQTFMTWPTTARVLEQPA